MEKKKFNALAAFQNSHWMDAKMKQQFILLNDAIRHNAIVAINALLVGPDVAPMVVEIKPLTRTIDQNSKLWACLADVSKQVVWHGRKLSSEEWKHVFTASLKKQEVVVGIDGGFVVLGQSTSNMSKNELADLIMLIYAFGAEHGVMFGENAIGR